jgi:hypothetical protein
VVEIVGFAAACAAVLSFVGGLVHFGWKKRGERKQLKTQHEHEALPAPPPVYPVRVTCREETEFHPHGGYHEGLVFEVYNESDHAVTVEAFGLDFTLVHGDEWHDQELAQLRPPRRFPERLAAHDGFKGTISTSMLSEDPEMPWEYVVDQEAFIDVAGFGRKVLEIEKHT